MLLGAITSRVEIISDSILTCAVFLLVVRVSGFNFRLIAYLHTFFYELLSSDAEV